MEYDYALSKNKPYFAVVIKDEAHNQRVRARGVEVIEAENPKLLVAFKAKVLGSISSFFEDCKDIKLTIHESMSAYARDPALPGWVSGREVQDMALLRNENDELKQQIADLRVRPSKTNKAKPESLVEDFEELEKILTSIQINVPKEIYSPTKENDELKTLQEVLVMASDALVKGVTSGSSGGYSGFLYGQVFPKLQIHGLAENEKPTGVHYRRSFLNKDGQKYLAWLTRKDILGKQA